MVRGVVLVFALLLVFSSLGQCEKDLVRVDTTGGCKRVVLSPEQFAYFYKAHQNLKTIEDSIPHLASGIEKERAKSDSLEANLEETVAVTNKQKELLNQSLEDCVDTAVELEVENYRLLVEADRQRKQKKWFAGGGFALGLLLILL